MFKISSFSTNTLLKTSAQLANCITDDALSANCKQELCADHGRF